MAFQRPTILEIVARVQADFVSRLTLTGAVLRRSIIYVLARVISGAAHMLHGHLEYLGRQLFPDLSDDPILVRQAGLFGVVKTPPTYATAVLSVTGTDGSVVLAGAKLQRIDGVEYTTDADVTIASGVAAPSVTAVLASAAGTLDTGVALTFESPIAGVDATATVSSSTLDGNDQEGTEPLRTRFLDRLASATHGGNDADYEAWAKEVSGVTRVWVSPLGLGPGTVVVRFARDNDVSPIPDSGEVAAVQTHINGVKPSHATVTVIAPSAVSQNFEVLITPDNTANRTAVTASLADMLLQVGDPRGGTLRLSAVRTAVGTTPGITDYTVLSPTTDTTYSLNQLPAIGTVTWS